MKLSEARKIRILLVEDNSIVRQIMSDMIVMQDDLQIVGEAEDGLTALKLIKNGLEADIVLADVNMEGMDGIELTEQIAIYSKKLKVIILTMHEKTAYLKRAMAAGARGYLLKSGDLEELYTAIRKVYAGDIVGGIEEAS